MYLTQTNKLKKLDKETFNILSSLCKISKNLYNVGCYNIRQYFFQSGKYLNYYGNYHESKNNDNYQLLGSIGQSTLRCVDYSFRSFFQLLDKSKKGFYTGKIRLPKYLDKDSMYPTIWTSIYFKIVKNKIRLSISKKFKKKFNITKRYLFFDLPKNIDSSKIVEVRINPKYNGKYFTISYIYKKEEIKNDLDLTKGIAVDFGISNLATCIDTNGTSFILDGKKLKSINRLYNKVIAKYKSILDKQNPNSKKTYSKRLYLITQKRNNQINNYLNHVCKILIDYCIFNKIRNIILGDFKNLQNGSNLGKKNNQNFVQIPFGLLKTKIRNKAKLNSIFVFDQEESYTIKEKESNGDYSKLQMEL